MKTLTVNQPFPFLICVGIKDIENRTWKTKFRGRILIHSGAKIWTWYKFKEYAYKLHIPESLIEKYLWTREWYKELETSSIIGSVEIVDCVKNYPSYWAEKDCYNWVLANPILFKKPISNVQGHLSFWNYKGELPEEI